MVIGCKREVFFLETRKKKEKRERKEERKGNQQNNAFYGLIKFDLRFKVSGCIGST